MTETLPTNDVLTNWSKAALVHAEQLIEDAKLVISSDSYGTAFGLAVAALEECGKGLICLNPKVFMGDDIDMPRLLKRLRFHEEKLEAIISPFTLLEAFINLVRLVGPGEIPKIGPLNDWAKRQHRTRMAAMYVDFLEDGSVLSPMSFAEDEARGAVDLAILARQIVVELVEVIPDVGDAPTALD